MPPEEKQNLKTMYMLYFFEMILGGDCLLPSRRCGIGAGCRVSGQISEGELRIGHHLVFNDGEEVDAYVVGQNSDFVF